MKILLVNSMCGTGSTGRIVEGIAEVVTGAGHEARIAYSLGDSSNPLAFKFGSERDHKLHRLMSHGLDMQGLWSKRATRQFVEFIKEFKPDVVNLHNIHGNFLNYPILFKFLNEHEIRIVWTLHDCWSFTGHCPHFEFIGCKKWKTGCHHCEQLHVYPKSEFYDGSKRNFRIKKKIFTQRPDNLHIVTVSHWLENLVKQSFLRNSMVTTINNGIDLTRFKPVDDTVGVRNKYKIREDRKVVLAVASPWSERKGLVDLIRLAEILDSQHLQLVIVGLSTAQIEALPDSITRIPRTDGIEELAALYTLADVFVNPTYEDSFPTVNLESLACGTPIVTYLTGGSPDAVSNETGLTVRKGDIYGLKNGIDRIVGSKNNYNSILCQSRASAYFDKNDAFKKYLNLYKAIKTR